MNILVTGGAGFIGSSLVERILAEGHQVEVVDNLTTGSLSNLAQARRDGDGRLKIHQADVRDDGIVDLIRHRNPDVIYHLVSSTDRGPGTSSAAAATTDVAGTVQVLEGAVAGGVTKVIVAGSVRTQYATDLRSTTRRMALDLVSHARERHGIDHSIVALPTVYGPRQREGRESAVVATFARRLVHGQPCVIHGDGAQSRDLLYIDDAVDALMKAVEKGSGLSIEVGTGAQTSVRHLYRAMAAIIGVVDDASPGAARSGEPGAVPVDPTRARMYLGWSAFTPLAEGLTETLVNTERESAS